jgi:epoxyqueuosine reductase
MIMNQLKQEMKTHGERLLILPIERLQNLKEDLDAFKAANPLNSFQQWILDDMYRLTLPEADFQIRSILLLAIPHPPYANVVFHREERTFTFRSLVLPNFHETYQRLKNMLEPEGYHILHTEGLPLKRLAACSGLAAYGRNNICYVEDMGSNISFDAYFSDLPCVDMDWTSPQVAASCSGCTHCMKACPTGAIRENIFLIDNTRCLSFLNEVPDPFPEWLSPSVHHTLYDCLRCQEGCPMNRNHWGMPIGPVIFDEEETEQLLSGSPYEAFSPVLKEKSDLLGMTQWLPAIPRNLKVLMEQSSCSQ